MTKTFTPNMVVLGAYRNWNVPATPHTYFLVQIISDGCGSRLVDDTKHAETSGGPCVLCNLTLGFVEVGRYSDDCVVNFLSKV